MNARHALRYALSVALYGSGAVALARAIRARRRQWRVRILAYHRFGDGGNDLDMSVPPALFLQQVAHLARIGRTTTLGEWIEARMRGEEPAGDLAIVTVDDGYADNREPLLRALSEHGVRSTLFVTTGGGRTRRPTPIARILYAIHHAKCDEVSLAAAGLGSLPLTDGDAKEAAIRSIDRAIRNLPLRARLRALRSLERQCGARVPRDVMLGWNDLRALHEAGIEIGAHTVTHPLLSGCDDATARAEIERSIARVRSLTARASVSFAYPFGGESDVGHRAPAICRASGASAAVTLIEGADLDDPYALPRTMVTVDRSTSPSGRFSKAVWACEVEGLLDAPRRVLAAIRARTASSPEVPA